MKEYGLLLSLMLRNRAAALRMGSWRKENGKTDMGRIAAGVAVVLSLGLVAGIIIYAEVMLFRVLRGIGQASLLPGVALLLSMASTLLMSFFHVLSGLYFSRDTQLFAYLPVRSKMVFASKMTEIWMGEVLFSAAILLPVFVMYGVHLGADALFYLRMVLIVSLAPVIPLCVIAVLTFLLARATALSRHKEAISVVFSLMLVAGVLVMEGTLLPQIPDDADAMFFVKILLDNEGLLNLLTGAFPPVMWGIRGLQGDWAHLGMYAAACIAAATVMIMLLGKGYLAVCLHQAEHTTRRRKMRSSDKVWKQHGQFAALFRMEWSAVVKNPSVAFNCLSGIVMFPLILVMGGAGAASSVDLSVLLPDLRALMDTLHPLDLSLILAAAIGFSVFMNPAVATAVSREGKRLDLSRMLPAAAGVQLAAKLAVGLLIDGIGTLLAVAIVLVLLPGFVMEILLAALLVLLLSLATCAMCLTLDAVRPNLTWTNEIQVVKQGANVAFGMLIGFGAFVLAAAPPLLLLHCSAVARFASAGVVLALQAGAGCLLLKRIAVRRYAALEPAN